MGDNKEKLVSNILNSYDEYAYTSKCDEDNILNRQIIIDVVDRMQKILYPGFFEGKKLNSETRKDTLEEHLEFVEYNLKKQIEKALAFREDNLDKDARAKEAERITDNFLQKIPKIREYLSTDVEAGFAGDPAAFSTDEIIFSYPGLSAITVYRIAHELYLENVPLVPRIMTEYAHSVTGIDINPGATIGKYFCIDHGTGIVIGETTVIKDNVKIYQGVTLGALSTRKGQQLKGKKRHPTIGNNVTIYSGTSVLGGDTEIGDDVTIGGNAFIVSSISAGTKVSVKNPELQYSGESSEELNQGEFWDWTI